MDAMTSRGTSVGPRPGLCYWCPNPADSDEDLLPRWVEDAIEVPPGYEAGPIQFHRTTVSGTRSRPVQRLATKHARSRCVCETCNNEWMSAIELKTKPLLLPLIRGFRRTLTMQDQLQIALWATMKAAVVDAHPESDAGGLASPAMREAIYVRREPPTDMVVRLAAFNEPFALMLAPEAATGTGKSGAYLAQWTTTFLIGHLAVQVFAITGSTGSGTIAEGPGGVHDGQSFTVWPPQFGAAEWPPKNVLARADLAIFLTEMIPDAPKASLHQSELELPCDLCGRPHGPPTRVLPRRDGSAANEGLLWEHTSDDEGVRTGEN